MNFAVMIVGGLHLHIAMDCGHRRGAAVSGGGGFPGAGRFPATPRPALADRTFPRLFRRDLSALSCLAAAVFRCCRAHGHCRRARGAARPNRRPHPRCADGILRGGWGSGRVARGEPCDRSMAAAAGPREPLKLGRPGARQRNLLYPWRMNTQARRRAIPVRIGNLSLGGDAPIVVQSMTNTDTADIDSTASQVAALARAGSELVRITVDRAEAAAAVP